MSLIVCKPLAASSATLNLNCSLCCRRVFPIPSSTSSWIVLPSTFARGLISWGHYTLSLVALDAEAEVASADSRIWYPIRDLFLGPGQSRIDPTRQVLTRFRFRLAGVREAS